MTHNVHLIFSEIKKEIKEEKAESMDVDQPAQEQKYVWF